MLLKSLQFTVKNLRGISRVISVELRTNERLQNYSRFASRRPSAIVNEDELFDVNVENAASQATRQPTKKKSKSLISKVNKMETSKVKYNNEPYTMETPKIKYDNQPHIEPKVIEPEYLEDASVQENKKPKRNPKKQKIDDSEPIDTRTVYTKIRDTEKVVSSMILTLKSKKKRKKQEQVLLEGFRFIKDAMDVGMVPEAIIFSRYEELKDLPINDKTTKMYKIPYRSIQLWSTLTTAPGIMGIFKRPEPKKISKASLPITVICDNVRDPGNMGSILRACAGVGCEQVLLTKGCVDFWDSKVLRSAAGAHFRVPIFGSQDWNQIRSRINQDAHIFVADNNVYQTVDDEELDKNGEEVEEIEEEDDDDSLKKESPETRKRRLRNLMVKINQIPVIPYYSADFTRNEVVLIVGGETYGLSKDSFTLVQNHQGVRVNIPLNNEIESLNAGMALGILAFEVKRQFLLVENRLNKMISN